MSKRPWLVASDEAVRDRVRRLPSNPITREAKRLVREDNDTLGAMKWLHDAKYVTAEHVAAHERWLLQQSGEDLA